MLLRRLFHPSDTDTLFVRFQSVKVVSWTFHKTGGNCAGVWRVRCPLLPMGRETPSTYVSAKYCSSERPSSGAIDFSQDSPVVTSATGRKTIPSSIPTKWRNSSSSWVWGKRLPNLPFPFLPHSGFWWCHFYRCRFYPLPFLPVALFTSCLIYRFSFYRESNGTTFSDNEWPLNQISRSWYYN